MYEFESTQPYVLQSIKEIKCEKFRMISYLSILREESLLHNPKLSSLNKEAKLETPAIDSISVVRRAAK